MSRAIVETALVGRDRARSVRHLGGAVGVFVLVSGAIALGLLLDVEPAVLSGTPVQLALFALTFGLAPATAYLNDGLLVSVALASAPLLGFTLAGSFLQGGPPLPGLFESVTLAVSAGLSIGVIGFLTGAVANRLRDLAG